MSIGLKAGLPFQVKDGLFLFNIETLSYGSLTKAFFSTYDVRWWNQFQKEKTESGSVDCCYLCFGPVNYHKTWNSKDLKKNADNISWEGESFSPFKVTRCDLSPFIHEKFKCFPQERFRKAVPSTSYSLLMNWLNACKFVSETYQWCHIHFLYYVILLLKCYKTLGNIVMVWCLYYVRDNG